MNAREKLVERKMERVGIFKTDHVSNVGMFSCDSNSGSIIFSYHCLHIISHNSLINVLKEYDKVIKHESRSKYDFFFTLFKETMVLNI